MQMIRDHTHVEFNVPYNDLTEIFRISRTYHINAL